MNRHCRDSADRDHGIGGADMNAVTALLDVGVGSKHLVAAGSVGHEGASTGCAAITPVDGRRRLTGSAVDVGDQQA